MSSDIVVAGGGVAGLVAARRLALDGLAVRLVERGARLGGQVQRLALGGVLIDAGAESFATRGGAVAALLGELGLADDIVTPAAGAAWLHRADGTAVPLPATAVLGIPADPLADDVVRVIGRAAAEQAARDDQQPPHVGADAATLGELVRARMGDAVADGLVGPIVRGVHSREPDALPIAAAIPDLRARLAEYGSLAAVVGALRAAAPAGSQVAGIGGGMFRLVDALAADLDRLGVRVETGVAVDTSSADRMLWACDPDDGAARRRVTIVTLVVDAPGLDAAPRGTGLLVDADAPAVAARALTHVSAKWEWVGRSFAPAHVLRLSYDGTPDDPVARATTDAGILLGSPLRNVADAAVRVWDRRVAGTRRDAPGIVGESAAGTGLAAVVAHAEATARAVSAAHHERMDA